MIEQKRKGKQQDNEDFNQSHILVSDVSAIGATDISPISNDEDLSSSSS